MTQTVTSTVWLGADCITVRTVGPRLATYEYTVHVKPRALLVRSALLHTGPDSSTFLDRAKIPAEVAKAAHALMCAA